MRILVVDDTQQHLDSAKLTLGGQHELVLINNYEAASFALRGEAHPKEVEKIYYQEGRPEIGSAFNGWYKKLTEEERNAHCDRWSEIKKKLTPKPFDAALIDLMMRGRSRALSHKGLDLTKEFMPMGFPLALLAAKMGIKYVAVATATNHHDHPMSESLDHLSDSYWNDKPELCPAAFEINGARVGFFHAPMLPDNGGKDWAKILARVLGTG